MSHDNGGRRGRRILVFSVLSLALYGALAWQGDLRDRLPWALVAHGILFGLMLAAWSVLRRDSGRIRWALAAALAFRVVAACGAPALSDDIHRYVWDGRVQLHGIHPYRYAPDDPALGGLRDDNWTRINHPALKTIYPPLAQASFLILTALGAGPVGFKLAFGMADFGVVLALGALLRALSLPRERVVLYAWNPLAVLETAGSGHVEPLGILLVVLAATWMTRRRPAAAALALAGAVQIKILPLVLLPGYLRRFRTRELLLFTLVVIALLLPYALTGPVIPRGLVDYAQRWERNAPVFPWIEAALARADSGERLEPVLGRLRSWLGEGTIPWDPVYRAAWPPGLARLIVAALALLWLIVLARRAGPDPARDGFLALGGVLLLSPTFHPWYLLWVLPFAAAYASWGWLLLALLIPLSYLAGDADVSGWIRAVEFVPLAAWIAWRAARGRGPRPL